jgi:hypothetical protein
MVMVQQLKGCMQRGTLNIDFQTHTHFMALIFMSVKVERVVNMTSILVKSSTTPESPWIFSLGTSKTLVFTSAVDIAGKLLQCIQNGCTSICNTHGTFGVPINPWITGPELVWQCKANILSIYCNHNNSCYLLSLECKTIFLVNCCWQCLSYICLLQGVLSGCIKATFATEVLLQEHHNHCVFHCWVEMVAEIKDKQSFISSSTLNSNFLQKCS